MKKSRDGLSSGRQIEERIRLLYRARIALRSREGAANAASKKTYFYSERGSVETEKGLPNTLRRFISPGVACL